MMEVVYTYEDFKARVDLDKPIHHDAWRDPLDREGILYEFTFRIYGISKNGNHVLAYETKARLSVLDIPKQYQKTNSEHENLNLWIKDLFDSMVKATAEPLGSTPGRWQP
jgi:hypothetical protein